MIDVLIPVLARPHRVAPLVESLAGTLGVECVPVFICSPSDGTQLAAVCAAGLEPMVVPFEPGKGDYALKMNYAVSRTRRDFMFLAADDLKFHPWWADRAIDVYSKTGACVVGTNDLGNRRVISGAHSTHTLVHRDYVECGTIDDPDVLLHPGYWHNFVDDEFVGTARHRETFAFAHESLVEHLHPEWGKAKTDATYERGLERFHDDSRYHASRRRLWRAWR